MKGFARRNQLIVTGLAIMIAVAGYLHFTSENGDQLSDTGEKQQEGDNEWLSKEDAQAYTLSDDDDSVETASGAVDDKETATGEALNVDNSYADLSAEDLGEDDPATEMLADAGKEKKADKKKKKESKNDTSTDVDASADASNAGEAVLVNNTISSDYFASAKLSREQTRAKNEETLMDIVNNTKIEEAKKEEAMGNLLRLTEISEMETAAETLLGAKGFQNAVVTMTEGSVDVVVDAKGLTKQQLVQIQDIVKRKTEVAAENIVITPVNVEE